MNIKHAVISAVALTLGSAAVFAGSAEDAMLTGKVKSALVSSPVVKATQVQVESKDGIVQLTGFVDSSERITAAAAVAAGVEGVSKVENNLKVKGSDRTAGVVVDDAMVTAKVKSALLADSSTHGMKIDVDTRKGAVQLNGFVASEMEKNHAQQLAAKIEGVKSVENNLTVKK
jgi:hyperosmotically inducible protein